MPIHKKDTFSLGYLLGALVLIMLLQHFVDSRRTLALSYSEFKQAVAAGQVQDLVIADGMVTGTLKTDGLERVLSREAADKLKTHETEHRFVTVLLNDPGLVPALDAAKVRYGGERPSNWLPTLLSWLTPVLVCFGIGWLLTKPAGGAGAVGELMSFGKSKAKVYLQQETGVTFQDVAGIDEAREELMDVVDFLKRPDHYKRLGGKIPKGVLIVGAPGTGKTLLAKAVAGEAGVPFLSLSGPEFVEMFVGVGAARVRDLFEQAAAEAPCNVFIDELDALGKARGLGLGGRHEEHEQTLNQLLVEMDGFDGDRGVIIMAATNRPEILDPALLRPGRFDRHVSIDKPDMKGRREILAVHVRSVKLAPDVRPTAIAARTPGFAGADLANLVNEAALRAAKQGKDGVDMLDFEAALERIVAGLEKRNRVMIPQERRYMAYHEAGHALVAEYRATADKVAKVSIIPHGIAALGYTQQSPTEDRYLLRKSELLDRLDVLLGGRVAEELVFHDVSTGAAADLQRATDMARYMVMQYGMSETLGLATWDTRPHPAFLPVSGVPQQRECSEFTAQAIDAEVRRTMQEARERVAATLQAYREQLEALAQALLEKETVDRGMLDDVLAASAKPVSQPVAADAVDVRSMAPVVACAGPQAANTARP